MTATQNPEEWDARSRLWRPGAPVLIRYVWRNRVWYAEPVTVVEDTPDRIAVYLPAGTATKWTWIDFARGTLDGPRDHIWHSTDVVKIMEKAANHAVWARWAAGGRDFLGWYVDLQDPLYPVPGGLVTWDRSLDIVVAPDLSWRWKDEDHFARIQELGWISPTRASAVREEGERVIERIERRTRPFDEPWPLWRPKPTWSPLEVPGNWATVPDGYAPGI